jgi:hypothetical protein
LFKAEVTDNAIEIRFSGSDLALLIVSALMLGVLLMLASWQVALVALAVSIAGTALVDTAQRWDMRTGRG